MASELESTVVQSLTQSELTPVVPIPSTSTADAPAPTLAPASVVPAVPSFQDIDSATDSDDEPDEQDWETIMAASEAAFSDDQVDEMIAYLKERGLFAFVKRYVDIERIPIPKLLLIFGIMLPPHVDQLGDQLRVLKVAASRVLRNRDRLEQYSTVDDAVELIRKSKRIVVLTGAGVSTSCGIPDFRSPTGLYARLKEEHWELDDPQQMFDLDYFKEKPNVFYSFAKEIYPSNFTPSPCHHFVKLLEDNGKLLRNYTQNIDGLFERVGVQRMLNCHGSFATASCIRCRTQFPGSAIEADVFASRVPLCPHCTASDAQAKPTLKPKKPSSTWKPSSDEFDDAFDSNEWSDQPLIKPDIVFFGESLSTTFDHSLLADREQVDLLIVIGTSLRVSPVAQIVSHLPHSTPQILVNRDPITHANFDVMLLGDGDTIVRYICARLGEGFDLSAAPPPKGGKGEGEGRADLGPERVGDSHVWLFDGSDRDSRFVKLVRQAYEQPQDEEEEGEGEREGEGGNGFVPASELVTRELESSDEDSSDEGKEREGGLLKAPEIMMGGKSRSRSPDAEEEDQTGAEKRFKSE